ncbi:MAG TPA: carboxypeptidase-like regulatory domain-containing protein [Pirellulales bacterium]|nr:carboxypeptidase-like regulatory domain-containing protein [Pirellulales bacterium]
MSVFVSSMRWLSLALLAVGLAGCGKQKKGPQLDLVPASGTVTLDGQPLADAVIAFAFQGTPPEGFYSSGATTDAQGHYELVSMGQKGTIPGNYKVTVSKQVNATGQPLKLEEGMDMEQLRASGGVKEMVPDKYTAIDTTDLTTSIENGKAEGYNFDLKSG